MINVDGLTKDFKKSIKEPGVSGSIKSLFRPKVDIIRAVENVSFHVPKGEILGLVGSNGAGKSTIIKMLTGILTPTFGVCTINGQQPQGNRQRYLKEIGVVFGQRTQLWWDLPLRETYKVLKEIYEIPDNLYLDNMSFLNEVLRIDDFISSPVRTLSLGQRVRADIAASLLHSPKVLFLDEPTIGLDVVVRDNIRKAIKYINEQHKTTVVLTTHDLTDVEELSDHMIVVDKGKVVFDGTTLELKNKHMEFKEIEFECYGENTCDLLDFASHFDMKANSFFIEIRDNVAKIKFDSKKFPISDVISYVIQKIAVKDIRIHSPSVEDIIKRTYK